MRNDGELPKNRPEMSDQELTLSSRKRPQRIDTPDFSPDRGALQPISRVVAAGCILPIKAAEAAETARKDQEIKSGGPN